MELRQFRVTNFRSVNDSGDIDLEKLTALVGRNESGKTNLLLALTSLNPAGGVKPLVPIKDFPRARLLEECKDGTPVLTTRWRLSADESTQITKMIGARDAITDVEIGRPFGAWRWVKVPTPQDRAPPVEAQGQTPDEQPGSSRLQPESPPPAEFHDAPADVQSRVLEWLPRFVYVSEFPELSGHQNLDEYANQRGRNPSTRDREVNFEKLTKVAEFDPIYLNTRRDDHETRSQILNRAGAKVTTAIRRLWKDRQLMVRFNLDGPYLDVLVADSTAYYPVEVNLDERSRGFRWFFSFYITFIADTQGGDAAGAVLLLDEPGLHLHQKSQEDLLRHLQTDYTNQIIYTTHSPFMLPPEAPHMARKVEITQETGTRVSRAADEAPIAPSAPEPFWRRIMRPQKTPPM
jgi:energy-coupling factor transporter ATP-binding protein EcfA2